jgi:hypothetical protein
VSEPNPLPDPTTGIQPKPAAPLPDTGIQANRPAGAAPPGVAQAAFLARIRRLRELHHDLSAAKPNPPMWTAIQFGAVVLGIALAFSSYNAMLAENVDKDMAGIAFVAIFFLTMLAPDVLLRLGRRLQASAARNAIVDFITLTMRNYPDEVEHCGGVKVLTDRVELEALLHVLEQQSPPDEPPV